MKKRPMIYPSEKSLLVYKGPSDAYNSVRGVTGRISKVRAANNTLTKTARSDNSIYIIYRIL